MPYCSGLCLTNLGLLVGSYNLLFPLFCQRLMDIASKIGPFRGKMHQKRTFAKVLGQNPIADQFQAATICLPSACPVPARTLPNSSGQIRLESNSEITHLTFNQATPMSFHDKLRNKIKLLSSLELCLRNGWASHCQEWSCVHQTWRCCLSKAATKCVSVTRHVK